MFLQTVLTNSRNFLERSMWGFGSAFLLTSCTDHRIPPPDSPVGDSNIYWNDAAKDSVEKQ